MHAKHGIHRRHFQVGIFVREDFDIKGLRSIIAAMETIGNPGSDLA
jgi:hypothetical protein